MADQMPASLFNAWKEYYSIEPFGAFRDNWHIGQLCAMFANKHKPKEKEAFTVNDFMYRDQFAEKQHNMAKSKSKLMQTMNAIKAKAKKA